MHQLQTSMKFSSREHGAHFTLLSDRDSTEMQKRETTPLRKNYTLQFYGAGEKTESSWFSFDSKAMSIRHKAFLISKMVLAYTERLQKVLISSTMGSHAGLE
jgi:hypothetical protein